MYDDNAFSTDAYDTNSWLFGVIQAAVRQGKRLFRVARNDIMHIVQAVAERWVTKKS